MAQLNGRPCDSVLLTDRSLQYGDGLFETILCINRQPQRLELHWQRLAFGLEKLGFNIEINDIAAFLDGFLSTEELTARAAVKIQVTRGQSERGYGFPSDIAANVIIKASDAPENPAIQQGIEVRLCQTRLATSPALAGLKHCNRLEQVLARSEWQTEDIFEGIMSDQSGHLVEGTMSNLFLLQQDTLYTPRLDLCGVAGVTRAFVLQQAPALNISIEQTRVTTEQLAAADEVFMCNAIIGIVPVLRCEHWRWAAGAVTGKLQACWRA